MSRKKTKTERTERQLAALDLLARTAVLPPALEAKRTALTWKLERLYEGAAKRQMRGLITRALHGAPPFERQEIDRIELAKNKRTSPKPPKMVWWYPKSSQRTFNAVVRGQITTSAKLQRFSGFRITAYRIPLEEYERKVQGLRSPKGIRRKKKMREILDQEKRSGYEFQED